MKYHGDDGAIKIVPQHSDIVGTSTTPANTVFLAIDECGNSIAETKILGTAHDAWTACEAMKRKCGNYWKDEVDWTDKLGWKHGEAEFNVTHQLAGLETMDMFKHHWYVKKFVVDT